MFRNLYLYNLFFLIFLTACVGNKATAINESTGNISISAPSALDISTNSITFTVSYKNAKEVILQSSDVEVVTTGSVTGTATVSGAGLESRTITVTGISGVGTLAIKILAGTATYSKSKKAPAIGPSPVFTASNLAPAISISAPSVSRTKNGPFYYVVTYTGASAIYLDSTYVSLTTDFNASGSVTVTGTGSVRTVTVSGITGSGSLGITIAADSAISSTGVLANATASSTSTIVDITPPTISISAPSASITKEGPVYYTVTYGDASAITLSVSNITLITTGTASGTVETVSGTGNTRTVKISSITGDGSLSISIDAATASDSVGNTAPSSGASIAFATDRIPPTIAIGAPSIATTNAGPVTYLITYSGASSISLTAAKVVLQKTGTANATVAVSGSGTTLRTITLSSITGDGTLGISLAADTASDAAGNSALASGYSASFVVDNTSSGIAFSAPSLAATKNTSVSYTVTYTDAASISLLNTDVTLVKTGTANATVAVTGAGVTTRTITLSSVTGNGTIAVKLASGTAVDSLGNIAMASGTSAAFTVDNIEPIIAISLPSLSLTSSASVSYTVTFTGASIINPLFDSLVVLNTTGTATGTVVVSGAGVSTRTITINGITGDGTLGIKLAAEAAEDDVGNKALATSNSATFLVDNTKPTIAISAPSKLATNNNGTVSYIITYSGASSVSLLAANVTLNGGGTGTVTVTGSGTINRNVMISGITGNGQLGISIAANTALDAIGNSALASGPSQEIYVTNDPLFSESWHLYNTGQTAFSASSGVAGIDLNLLTSWKDGYKGQGIKILVSDIGIQSAHDDLLVNFIPDPFHHDFLLGASGTNWLYANAEPALIAPDSHGTEVAGIIAAVGGNGKGGLGVAPAAEIGSANFRAGTMTSDMFIAQADSYYDIINQSWSDKQCEFLVLDAAYINHLFTQRSIYVKAAGDDMDIDLAKCGRPTKTRHGNANFDLYNNNPYTIVVGSVNAVGLKSNLSSPGSNLWVSGLGGEKGDIAPGIISTDIKGCTDGSAPLNNVNSFQLTTHPLNTSCDYTSSVNGTSAATATVSGAIAILLSANPALTARDVKHILAKTAKKINSGAVATANKYVASPTGHVWQQAWVTNVAGYHFHNYYGFGLIDVDAAVAMANSPEIPLAAEQVTSVSSAALALAIPDASATGVESSLAIAANLTIEAIQITPSITHSNIGQIGIELTSPLGTKSIIMNINNSLDGLSNLSGKEFLTNAFYGENSLGTWKLKVIDGASTTTGSLTGWTIKVTGH